MPNSQPHGPQGEGPFPQPTDPRETFERKLNTWIENGWVDSGSIKGSILAAVDTYAAAKVQEALKREHMQLYARGCNDPAVVLTANAEARRAALTKEKP